MTIDEFMNDFNVAIQRLYYWKQGGCDSFTADLYSLMRKSDTPNRTKLRTAYPVESMAYDSWEATEEKDLMVFFDEAGVPNPSV